MSALRGIVAACLFLGGAAAGRADEAFFETKIRPVLAGTCFRCHGGERTAGKLRVDTRAALAKGGRSGPAFDVSKPGQSLLVRAIRREGETPAMPPTKALPHAGAVADDFARWIAAGAPWPDRGPVFQNVPRHWSLQPVRKIAPPAGAVHPVDAFVDAKLRIAGLTPRPAVDRRTLLRRATFDLIGLPPTPEEMAAFLADAAPGAFARVVDHLLASPHYGERWGRHWLDVVRYADTAGETADFPVPDAWRYRNYVIDAFNRDLPYDQFLREQISGDLLAAQASNDAERAARLVTATGYISLARRFGFDVVADHCHTIDDTLDTLGKSVLGLTVGCARCHDHKYDPITAADYYALYGIFDSTRYPFPGCEKDKKPRDLVQLTKQATAYAVADGQPHDVKMHLRGDPKSLGEVVPRRFLEVLGGQPVPPNAGSGRLQLAEWLADPKNPLTARVLVNRVWQHHFGVGLVKTPNDFGTRGEPPTHPELLDYLAARFVEGGWSIKALHRFLMLSDAYRRDSRDDVSSMARDPGNALLWRYPRRRLSAEEIRDALLAVSGDLDTTPGGPHPFPAAKEWQYTQHTPFSAVYEHRRRSIYLMTQRIKRHPFLALFDGPDPSASTGARHTTTVPTQALFFLNDPFLHARAVSLATRLSSLPDDTARLEAATQLIFGRAPTPQEGEACRHFLSVYAADASAAERPRAGWVGWLRVLLSSNECLYVD